MDEEALEHRLRSFLANQPTGKAFLQILCTVITRHSKFVSCKFLAYEYPEGVGVFCTPICGRVESIFSRKYVGSYLSSQNIEIPKKVGHCNF